MKKKCYEAPDMEVIRVELEKGFMAGSVVDKDNQEEKTISINSQEVGVESNYFDNPSGGNEWDF